MVSSSNSNNNKTATIQNENNRNIQPNHITYYTIQNRTDDISAANAMLNEHKAKKNHISIPLHAV